MNTIRLVKNCLDQPDYLKGVTAAVEFLDQEGQGIGELRKITSELNEPNLFNEKEEDSDDS